MAVYEGSMNIDECETDLDKTVFSKLEEIKVCNRNIAYLMKEKKVFSYNEEDFEFEDEKITLKEDRIITLKKVRNLINRGFDAFSSYLLEKKGYDEIATDLINEQMPYDEVIGILLLQDNDMNIATPVIDDTNMKIYGEFREKGHKAIDTLVLLEIIRTEHIVFDPESKFYLAFKKNEITPRNINRMVAGFIEHDYIENELEARYEDVEDREIIASHISSYIGEGINPVSAATRVIDAGIEEINEKYEMYEFFIDSKNRYSPTEAFEKVFGTENLTRKILEQKM